MSDPNTPGPDAAQKLLANPTRKYRAGSAFAHLGAAAALMDGKPLFTWLDVPRMLRDPRVCFLEQMWRSPFQRVKFKVAADHDRVRRYVGRTIRKFWSASLPWHLTRYFRYGFSAGGAEFGVQKGQVVLEQVRGIEPRDARPLEWAGDGPNKGLPAGLTATGVGRVLAPHAFWFAGRAELNAWYDTPPLAGMFEPWHEKNARNGALASRRLWFWMNACRGMRIYYPEGVTNVGTDESPNYRNNADIAREIADSMQNGSTAVFVNDVHPGMKDKFAWHIEFPESFPDRAGLMDYPGELDKEMSQGARIPNEVFEAADVGSGWSGRMIPMMAWLGGVDELVGLVLKAFLPIVRYGVAANFGASAWFDVEPQSLVEQLQQKPEEGDAGGPPDPGAPTPGKKRPSGFEPYTRRDGSPGLRNPSTHQYREMSGSGFVSRKVRRKVKRLLAARDLSDGRAGGQHAPKGGVTIGGVEYPGGRFIPGEVIDKATPAEKAQLAGKAAKPERLPGKAVALAARVMKKGAAAAGKAEHVLKDAVLAAHAKLPAGLRGAVGAAFRLSMAGFDAGQAAAAAAALDRGVSPEHVAKVGHLLAVADVAMFKGTKALALLGVPGGGTAFAIAGSLPVASLCYLGYSAAANPVRTAKAAIRAVKTALKDTGRGVKDDAKSIPTDFAASVKRLAQRVGVGKPGMLLSDGRGDGGLEVFMAALGDADPARADWLLACFAAALAEANGDRDEAADLALQAAGDGEPADEGRSLSAAVDDDDAGDETPRLLAYVMATVQEHFTAKGDPDGAAPYLDELHALAHDPERLRALFGREMSWIEYKGKKGGIGWKNTATGVVVYTDSPTPPQERKKAKDAPPKEKAAHAEEAQAAAQRIGQGSTDPADVEVLARTIPHMTIAQLRATRRAVGAKLSTSARENMAKVLLENVQKRVERVRQGLPPEEPKDKGGRGAKGKGVETLASVVRGYGGIDPKSLDFLRHYEGMKQAVEDGIPMGVFKKGGAGLDVIAREIHTAGHFYAPEGGDLGEHLLTSLKQGLASQHADLTAQHEAAAEEYYRELEEAHRYASESEVAQAVRGGEEVGTAEGAEGAGGEGAGGDDDDRDGLPDAPGEDEGDGRGDAAEPDGDGVGDFDFPFGANVDDDPPASPPPPPAKPKKEPEPKLPTPPDDAAKKPDAPEYVEAGKSLLADPGFAKDFADSYEHQGLFVEHRDNLIPLSRLWYEMKKRRPALTMGQFHAAVDELSRDRKLQLHVLNETKNVPADEKVGAIERNDRNYFFARINPDDLAGIAAPRGS